jgi:ABC-type dipeptide/oligopeptide/nickel transport system ATPase component
MTKIFLDLNKHIYITGDVGSGKSVIAENALHLPDKYS